MDLMATKKRAATEDESKQVNVRLSSTDYSRLEKLAELLPITAIARAAMLIGLAEIEKRPAALLEAPPAPKRAR